MSARNGRRWVTFDGDQSALLVEDELSASHAAIGANGARHRATLIIRAQIAGALAHCVRAGPVRLVPELPDHRPAGKKLGKYHSSVTQQDYREMSLRRALGSARLPKEQIRLYPATP